MEKTDQRNCEYCGKSIVKKRFDDGKPECNAVFLRRKHCNYDCGFAHRMDILDQKTKEREESKELYCTKCKKTKPIGEFTPNKKLSFRGRKTYTNCRKCRNENSRFHHLKSNFGLTIDEYQKMLEFQGGNCFVCERSTNRPNLFIDHNHKTGLIRGLLCPACNRMLGQYKENINIFLRMIEYLKNPPATLCFGKEKYGILGPVDNRGIKTLGSKIEETTN